MKLLLFFCSSTTVEWVINAGFKSIIPELLKTSNIAFPPCQVTMLNSQCSPQEHPPKPTHQPQTVPWGRVCLHPTRCSQSIMRSWHIRGVTKSLWNGLNGWVINPWIRYIGSEPGLWSAFLQAQNLQINNPSLCYHNCARVSRYVLFHCGHWEEYATV